MRSTDTVAAVHGVRRTERAQRAVLIPCALGVLWVGGVTLLLAIGFRSWAYDDPFITFRYAANLRHGLGFVYNPGEAVLSTTTPLYTLLLAFLSVLWPWSDLPGLSIGMGAASLGLGSVALFLLGRAWRTPWAGLTAAVLYPFSPLLLGTLGAETCFYVMLILWAFALYAREQYVGAAIAAALATLTRADGVLVGMVLALAFVVDHRRLPWRPLGVFAGLVLPWFVFAWWYFGAPFPVTLAAKQHQARMAISDSFVEGFGRMVRTYARNRAYWPYGVLLLLGSGYAVARARAWLWFLAWGVLYFSGYALLGVSRYFWYYAPFVPVFLAGVGLGVEALGVWLSRLQRKRLLQAGVWALIGILVVPQLLGTWRLHQRPDPRGRIYRDVGLWLSQHTPPQARVGTLEVGIIGYYARRYMVDFAGLIQPEVAQQMDVDTTYADTARWAIETYRPDYLVLDPAWFPELMAHQVEPSCTPFRRFTRPEYPGELVVYQCQW